MQPLFCTLCQFVLGFICLKTAVFYDLENIGLTSKNGGFDKAISDSPLAKYVWENIDEYIGVYLAMASGSITDDEAVALSILACEDVSVENKSA